nr:MotA/TolQ/ExbB proton channel family protein [Acinetobacter sp. Marseille-Q1620]
MRYPVLKFIKFVSGSVVILSTLLPMQLAFAENSTSVTSQEATVSSEQSPANIQLPQQTAPTQKVANPYGIQAIWNEGDLVAKSTLAILLLMSIGTWYIIFSKAFQQNKLKRQAKQVEQNFWESSSLDSAAEGLDSNSAYRFVAEKGIHSTKNHKGSLLEHIDFNTWVSLSIQRALEKVQSHLGNGLAFLATVGSTAPFVGLFGTVWGIYHALTAIGISGQASIDKVAGPVGEALIMTAIGLAVAVPAVLGYNWLSRRNKSAMESVRSFGSDLHAVLLSGDIQNKPDQLNIK